MAKPVRELPIMPFSSASEFENWLAEHFEDPSGLWVKIAKKASGIDSVTYHQALDIALCFGWIDGQRRSFDDDYFLQKFTPRRARSKWSQINRDNVERLIEEGRMQPSGMAQINAAKADGRWEHAYASQSQMTVPEDLQVLLDANPDASRFFDGLDSANRYAILYRIHEAKRPETRSQRIEQYMEMLINNEKIY